MTRERAVRSPVVDPLRLEDLADGDAGILEAGGSYDALRFTDADVSGADLSGVVVTECEFAGLAAHETRLRGARFVETRIERLNAPVLPASRAALRDVEIVHSRVGSGDLSETDLQSVTITGCKLGWLNLRGARGRDILFVDCTIDELDLGGATLTRVAFRDCTARMLQCSGARLQDVDLRGLDVRGIGGLDGLRGATIDADQAALMSTAFAEHLGVAVR